MTSGADPRVDAPDGPFLIAGGGTAGHTNPGIAVGQALADAGVPEERVRFVGGTRGNERELVGAAGFGIDVLPGRGLSRRLRPQDQAKNVVALYELLRAVVGAWRIVGRLRPRAVLCLGGYAAAPATLAARLRRVPVVVSEQNARASAVNRWASRVAAAIAVPYPDTDLDGHLVGNPIRREVVAAVLEASGDGRARAIDDLGLTEACGRADGSPLRRVVAIWSGSLGARSVNDAARRLAIAWADRNDVVLYHVVGRRDWQDFCEHPPQVAAGRLIYKTVEYENRMPSLLAVADVAVCRAGASTTAELAVAGLPSVLIPLPGAPRDHQRANARELVGVGGAVMIEDLSADPDLLSATLGPLLDDPERLRAMATSARSVGRPGAAAAVAAMMMKVARSEEGGVT